MVHNPLKIITSFPSCIITCSQFMQINMRKKMNHHKHALSKTRIITIFTSYILLLWVCTRNPHRTESPLDGIPTGRNPHRTESPPEFHAVVIPFLGARNPHWTESPFMYFNLALQRQIALLFVANRGNEGLLMLLRF